MSNAVDVVCFGELLWDFYEAVAKTDKEPIAKQFKREIGGSSANLAIALAKLGIATGVVGAVGDDKLGTALESAIAGENVATDHVVKVAQASTGIVFITQSATGDATFIPYRGADLKLGEDAIVPAMAKGKYVVVSTTCMLPSLRPATEKFLAAAEKAKAILVVDLNVRAHLWTDQDMMKAAVKELAGRAALVKSSERDLGAVAGKRGMSWLDENAKQATWILTRGENGAAAVGEHGQATAPTKRVRCVDRSGGGDAFLAGALAVMVYSGAKPGSAEWKDPKMWTRALEFGHVLGAKVVASLGGTAGLTGMDEVKNRMTAPRK